MKIEKVFKISMLAVIMIAFSSSSPAQNLNKPIRESIEWLDVWMPETNESVLPRILLIGNSITRGYFPEVQKALAGKAYVARLATSKSLGDPGLLKEIELILGYYKFDIIHFNNGLHGWGYTEVAYAKAFPAFVKKIRKKAPGAKLIWATTTPIRSKADITAFDARTERVKVRNKIAFDYISKHPDILIDDLWDLTISQPGYYQGGDGTHPNAAGYKAIGEKVAASLLSALSAQK